MRLLDLHQTLPENARGAALALGNFDGVHLGHQAVIASAAAFAKANGAPPNTPLAATLFEPHPRRFFRPDAPPFRLQSIAQMMRAMSGLGVDCLFQISFDQTLAHLSADAFAQDILVGAIGAKHVSVGFNFQYGRGRGGDAQTLIAQGEMLGFDVNVVEPVEGPRETPPISSTAIRDAIAAGEMAQAALLLGRPWAIEGEVLKGFQRGRDIGFPTANVALGDYVRPKLGVYAVNVLIAHGDWRPGVASVGVNPTVGALAEPLLEAHIFDFDGVLYGRTIEVELVAFLREERTFPDMESMARQIGQDATQAKALLS
jgi:riboflavin kinase/FMN adenylyltransferase